VTTVQPSIDVVEVDLARHFSGILEVYRANDWSHARDPDRLRTAIELSSYSVVALEDAEVVGFARAMSDGAFAVYIADILVVPELQRRGIGRMLVRRLLERYPMDRFHHQVLVAERGAEGFYRRLGLVPVGSFGLTAFIRTRDP
jgi:ribosomal protein S18 acetylase RimI-like enzyme